ncbi:MAG: pyrroline-5-carboxylate reductase [Pseudomonadota bacterium]|nr:pyrroline-5-carboxylate reductase [Pseudomonadota bacterium]
MTAVKLFPEPTWFVGCGNMAGAMLDGWRSADVDLGQVVAIRPSGTPVESVRTVSSYGDAGLPPKLVVLGFKPQKLSEVVPVLAPWLTSKATILSLLAGAEVASLRARFLKAGPIVRAMPNIPVAVRRGVTALFGEDLAEAAKSELTRLMMPLGLVHWTRDEAELGAIGSLAGSGPAYVARFIAAFSEAGIKSGLDPKLAQTLAIETVFGTGWLAAATGDSMDAIARKVASPNGTTEAGLAVLDGEAGMAELIEVTLDASARRSAELAAAARSASS